MTKDTASDFINTDDLKWARSRLLRWYPDHRRSFPWRETSDPFQILVAEVLLKRTWADQVAGIFEEFIERYPDPRSLVNADLAEINDILWSLGLHDRGRQLQEIAKIITSDHGGKVPSTRKELIAFPGVGDYVAGAVLSLAFNQKAWIVDTNVVRVFIRFFLLQDLPNEPRKTPSMREIAKAFVSTSKPRKANLAILDHAFLVCTPKDPICNSCPITLKCTYFQDTKKS